MNLPALVDAGLQALGLRSQAPTPYDTSLLQKALVGTDSIGRLNPVNYQYVGGTAQWVSPTGQALRARLVGQVGRVNSYFAKKAAALPWTLWRNGPDGKPQQLPPNSPLLERLWQPNPMVGQVAFMRQQCTLYHGAGNVFIWANRLEDGPRKGQAQEFWILPDGHTKPMGGDAMSPVDFYRFTPDLGKPGEYLDLPASDVLHLKNDPLPGEVMGVSTIQSANREVTLDLATTTTQVSQLQNQGPVGIVSFPPDGTTTIALSEPQKQQLRERLKQDYTGPTKKGALPVVTEKVEFVRIGVSAVDLDILNVTEANFRAICSWWGVPSELVGDKEKSTYNNVAEARKAAYTDGVLPYLEVILPEWSRWACPMFEQGTWLQVDTSGVAELQADKAALVAWLKDAYWVSTQEKQEMVGAKVDNTLPKYYIPAGLEASDALPEGEKSRRFEEYPSVGTGG
ncbi:phage portal protein [Hymenobacter fodinae]|uniref:Phage portal protein n=1 Tax=Hymenobacter fodinae TaxID=2510796 RepID=A0A4Z0P2V1_9BACT|nr:phage portal protein [Hymenobacter fodinae]TGE05581.1 phage portal protein [Hymenobacter fodinae]